MRNKRAARSNIGIEIDPEVVEMWKKVHPIGFGLFHDDAINASSRLSVEGRLVTLFFLACVWKVNAYLMQAGFIGDHTKICLLIFRGCLYNKFAVFIEFLLKMSNLFL